MKRLIALLSGIALQLSPAMAHVGGPWSGNTYDNHTDGIFGGMITMRNGSGIFRFSATETAQLGAFSSSMIYYQGITFFGSCSATIDWESKTISGVTNGSAFNRSPRPAQQQTAPVNDNNPNWEPQRPGLAALTLNVPLSPIIVGDQITARTQPLAGLGATGPVGIANSHWSGKITKSKPTPKFEAKGQAAFVGARPLTLRFTIQEGTPPIPPDPGPPPFIVPGPLEEVSVDFGGNDPFPKPRNTQKIRVFGSRISYNVNASIGGLNGGLDGTGGGGFAF